jgi:hypothetical protein
MWNMYINMPMDEEVYREKQRKGTMLKRLPSMAVSEQLGRPASIISG